MNKEDYINRGLKVIKKGSEVAFKNLVNSTFGNKELFTYDIMNLEAALVCMESLSSGDSVEKSYDYINIHSHDCIFNNFKLSGWQNHAIISVIEVFHDRGRELSQYRENYIKKEIL